MAFLSRACSVVLLTAGASAFPVYDVDDGEPLAVNPLRGTAFSSVSKLGDSRVIECYADYANNGGAGTCKILSVDGMAVTEKGSVVFNANHTQYINVASFSSSTAVVCYLDHAGTEQLTCRFLDVGDSSIEPGEAYVVDDVAVQVSFSSLASLTDQIGIVCWSYPLNPVKDRAGVCNKLTLGEGGAITFGDYTYFDQAYSTSDVTVQAFSQTSAVVCWSAQGDGDCRTLSLSNSSSGSGDLDVGTAQRFFEGESEAFKGLALVKFNASRGLVCWADQVAKNRVDCKSLLIDGSDLSYGEAGEVTAFPSLYLTADAITEDAALVCYAADPDGSVLSENFDGKGTCNIVGLMDDDSGVGAGPPNEVNSGTTQFLAVASFDDSSAVLCYSDGGAGSGNCKALGMAETTTSSTETSTTTETTTTTATTTPHTTTETSTVSETSTTSFHTTTETSTTSSPHTTTDTTTDTTVTTAEPEDSGSQAPGLLGVCVALLAATGVALC
jgi:hypothetical protein